MLVLPRLYHIDDEQPSTGQAIYHHDLTERLQAISRWLVTNSRSKPQYMLQMIMYDISDNRIRTHIAKYLIKKGCLRIQKSVYLYKGTASSIKEIYQTLKEVNQAYDNADSILVLPMPQDKLHHAKIIGKSITFSTVIESKSVLIF